MGFALVVVVIVSAASSALWALFQQTSETPVTLHALARSDMLPTAILVLVRSACATAAGATLYALCYRAPGFEFRYHHATVILRRHTRFTTFTSWCFTLLCGYFMLATTCSIALLLGYETRLPSWLPMTTLILFEVSYPMSFLVTAVVTLVLIPTARRHNHPTARMFRWRPLMMHSGNVLMMQGAMLSSPPPVLLTHLPYAVLFSCSYALFAWYWFRRTGVFYYFFLDYRRPAALWAYLGLLATIALLYVLSYGIALLARHADSRWWTYPCLILLTLCLTRFRAPVEPGRPETAPA